MENQRWARRRGRLVGQSRRHAFPHPAHHRAGKGDFGRAVQPLGSLPQLQRGDKHANKTAEKSQEMIYLISRSEPDPS